jgi:hypothetical protein
MTSPTIPKHAFMTSAQLANFLGVTDRWVRKLAIERGFGTKFGHTWMFTQDECQQLLGERKSHPSWHGKRKTGA